MTESSTPNNVGKEIDFARLVLLESLSAKDSHRSPTAVSIADTFESYRSRFVVNDRSDSMLAAKFHDLLIVAAPKIVSAMLSPSITA